MTTKTKTCHVSLMVEALACVEVNADCPEDEIGTIAREAVSLFPTGQWVRDVFLEIENIKVGDIVEITRSQETDNAR